MRENHIERIRKACIEANSELVPNCSYGKRNVLARPIRLTDVLLVIEKSIERQWLETSSPIETLGNWQPYLEKAALDLIKMWNLRKDDLTEQSDECLKFIASLIYANGVATA